MMGHSRTCFLLTVIHWTWTRPMECFAHEPSTLFGISRSPPTSPFGPPSTLFGFSRPHPTSPFGPPSILSPTSPFGPPFTLFGISHPPPTTIFGGLPQPAITIIERSQPPHPFWQSQPHPTSKNE